MQLEVANWTELDEEARKWLGPEALGNDIEYSNIVSYRIQYIV